MGDKRAKSKSKSDSGNYAYQGLSESLLPSTGFVGQGGNAVSSLLGLQGNGAQSEGLKKFADSGGMKFILDQGNEQISGSQANRGLFASGDTGRELVKFGQGVGSSYLDKYMESLLKLSGTGLGASGVLSDAGKWGTGSSSEKGPKKGLFSKATDAAAAGASAYAASDSRLKTNIKKVGEGTDGHTLYDFDYIQTAPIVLPKGRHRGYMADELSPADLGPEIEGFKTVANPAYFPVKLEDM